MERREKIFFVLASVFVSSLVMANIIGITKFFEFRVPLWGHTVMVPVGILPYPVTFLATDLISELYGRKRASYVVLVGFLMNLFLIGVCGLGEVMSVSEVWRSTLSEAWHEDVYPLVWGYIWIGVQGSMAAYLVAQLVDVQLFHIWKKLTRGKHFWLRNNASTMCSQFIDTTIITLYVFGARAQEGELQAGSPFGDGMVSGYTALLVFIFNAYLFKLFFAAFDTPFAYLFRSVLRRHVGGPDPGEERYGNE
ncbi:MAG: queuosine precursor transporter [Planctomycetota bacterium]|nr:queuosine precursor transporter [Planctomycetota bacterium]